MSHTANNLVSEAVKITPPSIYVGATILGMTPAEWVTMLTLLYLVIQLALAIPKLIAVYTPKVTRLYISACLLCKSKKE